MFNQNRIGIIIQARMTSTRLPGKVLLPVYQPPPIPKAPSYIRDQKRINASTNQEIIPEPLTMLESVINRCHRAKFPNLIIIATTTNQTDDPIVELVERLKKRSNLNQKLHYTRGSENHVLERYHQTAQAFRLSTVIRITSDCPLIDPVIIDSICYCYLSQISRYDYVSNTLRRSYPRGMDIEVFSANALEQSYEQASDSKDLEHVTHFIYTHPEQFRVRDYTQLPIDQSKYRLTVDTEADLKLIKEILNYFNHPNSPGRKPEFSLDDLIKLLEETKPELVKINQEIEQKDDSAQLYLAKNTSN